MTSVPPITQTADLEQRTFRAMLSAMSMPGTVEQVSVARAEDGPWAAAIAVAQSLLDHEVTFHMAASNGPEETILRRTGSRTAPPDRAAYVFADAAHALAAIEAAYEGPLEEPERSSTVVVLCDAVGEGDLALTLSGPGVDGETTLRVGGLDPAVLKARTERNWPFPTGIDLLLVDPRGRLAALPRSTTATIAAPQEVS
ncbi:MAG: phosphonate C-P lyase system protein PhnH [Chloroflexi bacterium HGW-Chloroflexi-9]|nr:MAG: phosphonate C-P lyase system protein PhnH [Chloroflexi bacterium HGW-Chloroflexi-9]